MAHTAIRLGYLSISSGGGGAGFEEYANLAAFPPIGEAETIYLAADTKKIYVWTGSAYEEVSSSEDKANRDLDNLIETSIPDGVGLNSVSTTSFSISTSNSVTTNPTGAIDIHSGNIANITSSTNSGTVTIRSGETTGSGNTGDVFIYSGNNTGDGQSGNITITPGTTADDNKTTGSVIISSGYPLGNSNSGKVSIFSNTSPNNSGDLEILSGDSTAAGNSGDIILSTGGVTSGNRGLVKLNNNTRLILQDDIGDKLVRLQLSNGVTEGYGQFFFNRIRSDKEVFIGAMESHVDDNGAQVVFSGTFSLSDTDGQYKTSDVRLQTLSNSGFRDANNVAVSSGDIYISTHPSFVQGTETNANTGNISLNTGNPSGSGVRGNISLNGDYITVNSKQIKNLANGTSSNDAVNLSQLTSAISPLEDISEIYKFYAYENNASIYADGRPGIRDTSALIRDGWYYQNSADQKINWYFFDGNPTSPNYQGAISQSNFSTYVVMTLDSKNAKPIIGLYSLPTGVGDALPGFAHSRWIYQLSTAALAPLSAGKQYLFYTGSNPSAHPEIPHIQLDLVPAQSIGDLNPAELILTAALNSDSVEPAGDVQWMVESLGVWSPSIKQEMDLRIRTVPLNTSDKIDAIYLPSYVDDVVEYANLAAFPPTGETGKIYVALDTNKIYRWSGSAYIEISPSESATWGSITGTLSSQTDLQEALDDKYDASNPAGYITLAEVPESAVTSVNTRTGDVFLTRVDVGLGDVDNTSDLDKPISTATQTALDDKANENLDNLTATAIPDGINLESISTNTSATTGFQVRTKTQTTSNSGSIRVISGDVTGDFTSGGARVWSGDNLNAQKSNSNLTATGLVTILSGSITSGTGSTGNVALNTGRIQGSLSQGNTGPVSLSTGNNDGIGNTGDINFTTGEADQGNSGNINFTAGLASGNIGKAFFRVAEIDVDGVKITSLANGTLDGDAVNLSQLNDILDYTPADTSAWIAPVPDDVKEALDQLADRLDSGTGVTITAFEDMKEPTGFINRTDSTISFDDSTRIFTIAPVGSSFSFYIKGNKFTKTTAQTVTIPDTSGSHYIYFNTSGVLVSTQVFDISIIEQDAYVSLVYWNTDTIPHSRSYFAEERHGITMDGTTHAYLHTIFGARYLSGLALGGFTIGNGTLDSHAQFTSDSGSIRDEDILHTIGAQTQIPILFRQGQLWRKKAADNFPVIYSGSAGYTGANGRLPYNQYTGGAWQLTEVSSNKFVLVHYFATNDVDNKVVGIQGIAEYNDIPAARNAASTEITTLSDLPFTEFVPIGTVIFQTNTYTNAIDARIVPTNGANYMDFRGTQLYTPAGEATEHSLLSGLADDDHIQYHTDARGDARYNLKSTGDISETSYSITNSQTSAHNITGFAFDNAIVRSFEAEVSVKIDADTDLFEKVSISGIHKSADWEISIRSLGDSTGIVFSITSAGQLQYTSLNYTGFVSGVIKFRATTLSI